MPFGCGTWPAFWLLGPDWPRNGEIGECDSLSPLESRLSIVRYH